MLSRLARKDLNKVEPSFIRVEADGLTYNLHIMLRLEMELALLEGKLSVEDAPGAWNEKMESYLGITPPTDSLVLGFVREVSWLRRA